MNRVRGLAVAIVFLAAALPSASAVLRETVRERIDQGRYREAAELARQLVAEEQERSGPQSLAFAEALDIRLETLDLAGLTAGREARELVDTALNIKQSLMGPDDPAVAVTLDLGARIRFGEPKAARALLERSLAIREKALSPEDPAIGASCYWMAKLLVDVKELPEARKFVDRALTLREKTLGREHPETLRALVLSGELLALESKRTSCVEMMDRAVAMSKSVLVPDHPETGLAIRGLAFCSMIAGNPTKAKPLVEQALAMHEASLGRDHPWVSQDLTALAWINYFQGDEDRAIDLDERALAILERAFGPDDARLGIVLNHLADFLEKQGDPQAAAGRAERALAIARRAFDERHAAVAFALQRLGNARFSEQRYSESFSLLKQASTILKDAHGPESNEYSGALGNQARPAMELGDWSTARSLIEESLAIHTKLFGSDSLWLLTDLTSLGTVSESQGDRKAAIDLNRRQLSIIEKQAGAEDRRVIAPLMRLCRMQEEAGEIDEARRLAERALGVAEKGGKPRDIAWALFRIGILLRDLGELPAALAHLERGYALWCETMGSDHPAAASFLRERALVEFGLGRNAAAFDHALQVDTDTLDAFRLAARYVPSHEAEDLSRQRGTFIALTLLDSAAGRTLPPGAISQAWDCVIRSRGAIVEELAARHRVLASGGDPALAAKLRRLQLARTRLSRLLLYQVEAGDQVPPAKVKRARDEVAALEIELAEGSAEAQFVAQRRQIGLADVMRSLPPKSAIVAYDFFDRVESVSPLHFKRTFMAFVLAPDKKEATFVSLGSNDEIDNLVVQWRRYARTRPAAGRESGLTEAAAALRRAVWDPVRESVEGADLVFIVPAGSLYDVSFPALQDRDGRFLIENHAVIHQLTTACDIVPPLPNRARGTGLLALGDPDFDGMPSKPRARTAVAPATHSSVTEPYRALLPPCASLRALHFDPLPHSGYEVNEIVKLWKQRVSGTEEQQVVRLLHGEAGERAFKQLAPGRRVIHLASHATFLGTECDPPDQVTYRPGVKRASLKGLGLVALAGANLREKADPAEEDGVLTTEEIVALDLTRAEWVVLSACDTARSTLLFDDGAYSLQRAFRLAGARTVIASLWPIPDSATAEWMRRLYAARARGATTAAAVHDASLDLLLERRRRGLSTHPLYWGSFVASGDWR